MLAVPASMLSDFLLRGYLVPLVGVVGIVILIFASHIDEAIGYARKRALRSCEPHGLTNGVAVGKLPSSSERRVRTKADGTAADAYSYRRGYLVARRIAMV